MQRVEQPGEKLDRVALLLDHKPLVAARHDGLHELVRADLRERERERERGPKGAMMRAEWKRK